MRIYSKLVMWTSCKCRHLQKWQQIISWDPSLSSALPIYREVRSEGKGNSGFRDFSRMNCLESCISVLGRITRRLQEKNHSLRCTKRCTRRQHKVNLSVTLQVKSQGKKVVCVGWRVLSEQKNGMGRAEEVTLGNCFDLCGALRWKQR